MTFDKDFEKWSNLAYNAVHFKAKALGAKTPNEFRDALFNAKESQRLADDQYALILREYPDKIAI